MDPAGNKAGSCKPELGGWRNQLSASMTASGLASSRQNWLVWSARRDRRQGREGRTRQSKSGKVSGQHIQAGEDIAACNDAPFLDVRETLSPPVSTEAISKPGPRQPNSGRWHNISAKAEGTSNKERATTPPATTATEARTFQVAKWRQTVERDHLPASARCQPSCTTASVELPASQAEARPSPARYYSSRPRRRAAHGVRPRQPESRRGRCHGHQTRHGLFANQDRECRALQTPQPSRPVEVRSPAGKASTTTQQSRNHITRAVALAQPTSPQRGEPAIEKQSSARPTNTRSIPSFGDNPPVGKTTMLQVATPWTHHDRSR